MRRSRLAAFVLGGALLVAACGDNDSPSVAETGTVPTTAGPSAECPSDSGLTDPVTDHGAEAATGAELDVGAGDSFFSPTCVTEIAPGTVQLTVHNDGAILHNVSFPDQGIDSDVGPGETVTVTVDVGSDPLTYFCKYHRTSGMVGALIPTA